MKKKGGPDTKAETPAVSPTKESDKKTENVPIPLKFREDTIPVIVVNGVYYPSQRLRFKLNDPNMNFRKITTLLPILESFNERYFGIVSKRSDSDDSHFMVGTLVRVID
jgi:hypothetical protein